MNVTRDPESILNAWLDEGPTDLPDATRRAILTSLPTTPQARRGHFVPPNMNSFARAASVLVVAVVMIGVVALLTGPRGGVGAPSPSPVPSALASAPPLPTLDATYISPSYGYQVGYPTGWSVTDGAGPWPPGTDRMAGNPVSDAIVRPTGPFKVRFNGASIALPSGMTMEQFRAFASPLSSPFNPSACSPIAPLPGAAHAQLPVEPAATAQPVQAVVSVNGCGAAFADLGGYIYDVEAIAAGRGYTFTLDGYITTSDALAWLATITLEPASAAAASAVRSHLRRTSHGARKEGRWR